MPAAPLAAPQLPVSGAVPHAIPPVGPQARAVWDGWAWRILAVAVPPPPQPLPPTPANLRPLVRPAASSPPVENTS
eukprot:9964108-Alexandrium_andersonii.AAC.1